MARFNARTPSNGAPGIIVRRRKRDRERLRQRWEKRKLEEEARKSGEKSQQIQEEGQADEEYANAATPGSEDVVMEGSETEETTTIGSEGEHNEVSTDAVLDTTVNIEVTAPTPPDRTLGVEVQVRDEQVAIDGETADKKALTPEEEELSEDKPTTETESNQDNAFTTSTKPHTDTPPTVERTEEMEHDHIPGPVESSLNPSVTVEEKLHDTQDSMSEDTKELKYVSEDPDSIPEDTGYVKRDTNVQAAELDCKFPQPDTNPPDEKHKPSLTPLKTSTSGDNDDTLPTPPLSAHEPERRSSQIQAVVSTPQRTRTPRKAPTSTPAPKVEVEPRYSLRNSARKTTVLQEENHQATVTPTAKKRKRRASSPISPDSGMQIEDIDGDIRLEEGVTEEIIVPSGDPQEPSEPTTPPPKRRKSTRKSIVNSPYFTAPRTLATVVNVKGSGRTPKGISVTPWPPFTAEKFGLVQEELRDNPFHLLISTTFLNRTKGSVARPLLDKFLSLYPTPEILSTAPQADLETLLQPIGLYRVRAERLIKMATEWLVNPPGAAEKVLYNYPAKDTPPFPIPGREPRGVEMKMKWEIAHLPGVGAYALDSWRIFCRDALRGGVKGGDEEWRSVVPKDKELRAYCRWMWAKDGVVWEEEGDAYAHRAGQEG